MSRTSETIVRTSEDDNGATASGLRERISAPGAMAFSAILILLAVIYYRTYKDLHYNWNMKDSYYSHGFIVPFVSLYFVWRQRRALLATPVCPAAEGFVLIAAACLMSLVGGDYLSLRLMSSLSLLPMIAGLVLVFLGRRHLALLWFPIAFLIFMIPIPASITQGISLRIKLLATDSAVSLGRLLTLPLVRNGSYVNFGGDRLLIGEVCGGLRSLIALLAFGALMAYISKTRAWCRVFLFLVAGPIAVASNIIRILFLCVVAYFWGSEMAVGKVHDISGILIFAIAFFLYFSLETMFRRVAPAEKDGENKP